MLGPRKKAVMFIVTDLIDVFSLCIQCFQEHVLSLFKAVNQKYKQQFISICQKLKATLFHLTIFQKVEGQKSYI